MGALALLEPIKYYCPNEPEYMQVDFGGVQVRISKAGHVTIDNAKSITFKGDDINLEGKRVNVHATEEYNLNVDGDIYMGSSTHIIHQAPRVDWNPRVMHNGYNLKINIKEFISNGYSDDRSICCSHRE